MPANHSDMDDNGLSIGNREDDIPVIRVTSHDNDDRTSSPGGKRAHLRSKSQEALSRVTGKIADKMESAQKKEVSNSMQDRLLNLYVYHVIHLIMRNVFLRTCLMCSSALDEKTNLAISLNTD